MKAKKLVAGFTALVFSALVLGACSPDSKSEASSSEVPVSSEVQESTVAESSEATTEEAAPTVTLQDGTYTLEETNYSNDYRVVFSIVVEGGKIVESNYDNVNEAGESKAKNAEYNKMMKDKAGISPEEFIPAFNEALVAQMAEEEGAPGNIDVVTGATHSFHTFVLYAEQLINAAENGATEVITIDNPTK